MVIDCKKWTLDLKNFAVNRSVPVPLDAANMTRTVNGIAYNITELSAYGRNVSAAIREAAHFGRELPEAIHLDVRVCSTDRWVDFQKYVFVPLVLAAMTVLLFVVGYRYWQSYYGLKGRPLCQVFHGSSRTVNYVGSSVRVYYIHAIVFVPHLRCMLQGREANFGV